MALTLGVVVILLRGQPGVLFITGTVTDRVTGKPVEAIDFILSEKKSKGWSTHQTFRDKLGRFHAVVPHGGQYRLSLRSPSHLPLCSIPLDVPDDRGLDCLHFELDPGCSMVGRVVESVADKPVEGAIVRRNLMFQDVLPLDFEASCTHTRTDAAGRFRLQGLEDRPMGIVAFHPDHAYGGTTFYPDKSDEAVIRLKRGYRITGQVLNDEGEAIEGVFIRMFTDHVPVGRIVKTDSRGYYRTPPVPPGVVHIEAVHDTNRWVPTGDFVSECKDVDIVDRDVVVDFGLTGEHLVWVGTLFGWNGEPLPRSHLHVTRDQAWRWKDRRGNDSRQSDTRYITTDDQGRFEVKKLLPGRYRVWLHARDADGLPQVAPQPFTLRGSGRLEKDIRVAGGVIRGQVVGLPSKRSIKDMTSITIRRVLPSPDRFTAYHDEQGRFGMAGLPPGVYTVSVQGSGIQRYESAGITVREGETRDDVRVTIPLEGTVKLKLEGFSAEELEQLLLDFSDEKGTGPCMKMNTVKGLSECCEERIDVKAGPWKVQLSFTELGVLQRSIIVPPDGVMELAVARSEFDLQEDRISKLIELPVFPSGWARIIPCKALEGRPGMVCVFTRQDASRSVKVYPLVPDSPVPLTPGAWIARIEHDGEILATWSLYIAEGDTTRLVVD